LKIPADRLAQQLNGPLQRVYVIAGDETLLVQEAADQVRKAVRKQGFDEREVAAVEARYDWSALKLATGTLSLFASKRLIELRLSRPLKVEGGKALTAAAASSADDTVILVVAPRFESASTRAVWYKALEKAVVLVALYPLEESQLPRWVSQRMQARGLQPSADAVDVLVQRSEGNLLACSQDIEKLLLLHGSGPLDAEAVIEAVSDNARFDVFALGEAALQGRSQRVVRIMAALRSEGVAPPLILWSLSRELRTLALLHGEQATGRSLNEVLADRKFQVWPKRRPMVQGALQRNGMRRCRALLQGAARIDRMIKGADSPMTLSGRRSRDADQAMVWDALLALSVGLASSGRPPIGF
jgi:DNA polymerase-3 subunit delta